MYFCKVVVLIGAVCTIVSSDCSVGSIPAANDYICPSECSTNPCSFEESECCLPGTWHPNPGCNQCQDGYFKKDYNFPCTHCQATFGNECMHCQDFNGCGQCIDGCTRTYDELCGLWYCDCGNEQSDITTYELPDISTFDGEWPYGLTDDMPYYNDEGEYDDPDNDETIQNLYDRIQLRSVDSTGKQYITVFSMRLIQQWLNEAEDNNQTIVLPNNDGQNDDPINDPDDGPTPCEIEIYDQDSPNPNDNNGGVIVERRLRSSNRVLNLIFDPDTRTEITGSPPTASVSKHVGYIYYEDNNGDGHRCTAFAIYDKYLLTAAHCVYSRENDEWYDFSTYKFYPKRRSDFTPTAITDIIRIAAMRGWTRNHNRNYDVGIITLNSNHGLGWPCFGYTSKRLKKGHTLKYRGYPSRDKDGEITRGLWTGSGTVWKRKTHQYWSRTIDWTGGASGSPMFTYNGDVQQRCVYGVVTHHGDTGFWLWKKNYNGCVRFTSSKFNSICAYTGRC